MLSVWMEGMGGRGSVECVLRGSEGEGVLSVCGGGQEQKHKVKAGD